MKKTYRHIMMNDEDMTSRDIHKRKTNKAKIKSSLCYCIETENEA